MIRTYALLLMFVALSWAHAAPSTDDQIEAKLAETVIDVDYATTFEDAIQDIAKKSGLNAIVQWNTLELEGIDRNVPVKLSLKQVRADQVLRHLMDQAGGGVARIEFVARDGALVVTTGSEAARHVERRVYDVSDLLLSLPPQLPPDETARADEIFFESLRQAIQAVEADTWRDNGGLSGEIRQVGNTLVIQQTRPVHRQVAALIDSLRQARSGNVRLDAHILIMSDEELPAEMRASAAKPPILLDAAQVQSVMDIARRPGRERLVASVQTLIANGRRAVLFDDAKVPEGGAAKTRYRCHLEIGAAIAKDESSISVVAWPELTDIATPANRTAAPRRVVQTAVEIPTGKTLLLRGIVRPGEPTMIVLINPTIERPAAR